MTTRAPLPAPDTTDWRNKSECRHYYGSGPMLWDHDAHPADRADAIRICRTECAVRLQCLEWARENKPDGGVWGGIDLTPLAKGLTA